MALSAYFRESPLEHIVSITMSVAGAAFAVKTRWTELFYGSPQPGAPPDQLDDWFLWENDLNLTGTTAGPDSGGSSALIKENDADPGKPAWVISGFTEGFPNMGTIILYSANGSEWEPVFQKRATGTGVDGGAFNFSPTGIVWDEDEKAFFAAFYIRLYYSSGGGVDGESPMLSDGGEEIYRSADGKTWTLVSQSLREDVGEVDAISDISPHCNKPENENRGGGAQKIPDGLQGYNATTGTFIKPTSLIGFEPQDGARYDSSVAQASVTVIGEHHGGIRTVSAPCYAVAYFNNVWIAVGGNEGVSETGDHGGTYIDVSFDDGDTWTNVFRNAATFRGATVSGQRPA